ncbi:MAG: fibronectin type III domain-containing protein, partial [Desulfuromonadales bacterium]|nr:fibronectin type III domain-containing protein [Desulfuromonadales bacterium]
EFLRNEVNGTGHLTLPLTGGAGGGDTYIVQSDPFFAELKGWGNTLWGLWVHNMDKMGAAPFLMAQAVFGTPPEPCMAPAPSLLSTDAVSSQVTLNWSDEHTADESVTGYTVYYDQAGKSQLLADTSLTTSFTDTGLTNDQQYCYKVTSKYEGCESEFSNILCAIPTAPGQGSVPAGVESTLTGFYSGKGGNRTFNTTTSFSQGDTVVFQGYVLDQNLAPVEGATVDLEIEISGSSSATVSSGTSDATGMFEGSWKTSSKRGGTPTGTYTATTTGVTATGYEWDTVPTSTTFELQ